MTFNERSHEAIDFDEFFARWRADRLAKLVAGQPPEFWTAVGKRLEDASDGTITTDELIGLLHQEGAD